MDASIIMPCYNKANVLPEVFSSILDQNHKYSFEIIAVDDGSSDNTKEICEKYNVKYKYLDRPYYTNPAKARNECYKLCNSDIIISQSAEIIHKKENNINLLIESLKENDNSFIIGKVDLVNSRGQFIHEYAGSKSGTKLMFLGSVWREDIFKIKGDSEDFKEPGCEDSWFILCLRMGLGRKCVFNDNILGWHVEHSRPSNTNHHSSRTLYNYKKSMAEIGEIKYEGSLEV